MSRFESSVGRYVYLDIEGVEYRVYFEESGGGIPLLLQHTAGADGRQWRHLLADPDFTRNFRVVAYDLPFHGKSLPPTSERWWEEEYRLTASFLMSVPLALSAALDLDRPIYMGSSIGGHLALDLALHHPDDFRAVVGLEAALFTPGGYMDILNHPRVSNQFKAYMMYGLMAPQSPEWGRRETSWVYSQGAPPVFKGDLYYFSIDHDLRESIEQIDTSKIDVRILNGEYDWACTPDHLREIAERLPGADCRVMDEIGHFPMSENPARFKELVLPVLDEIRRGKKVNAVAS
ncbi:MAG: alpha/beta hydrolase [Acidobacteriota bacterium]|nr:alpha/beta hydrolase [Acidobacteriota bacterium]